ncbi:MAG: glycosyltransferase [Steroidobacteraceae bacterium]
MNGASAGHSPPGVSSSGETSFRPTVLHASEYIKGGILTYLEELLPLQSADFGEDRVTAVLPASHCKSGWLRTAGGIITFDDSGGRVMNAVRLASKVAAVVADIGPDIVHVHSTFAGMTVRVWLALLGFRGKVVYCPHGWAFDRDASRIAGWVAKLLERGLARFCDRIVCISLHEYSEARALGLRPEKLAVVRNGIRSTAQSAADGSVAVDWPAGARRVLFVGRLDRQKGTDVLFSAMHELGADAFAYIAGDVALKDAPPAALPANARRVGWLSPESLQAYYRSADLLVVPSRWEGFGLVALEAMRAGLPVIASSVGGLREIVDHGVTGWLIPSRNVEALVGAIRQDSTQRLKSMGRAGRERFLRYFTSERMHAQICAIYKEETG